MRHRLWSAAIWVAAGFLLGAAAFAGGQGDEDLREKLIELEDVAARLRALESEESEAPAVGDAGYEIDYVPLADVAAGVPEFLGPRRVSDDDERPRFGCQMEECPQPFGTIEEITELVRRNVRPEDWETGSQITCQRDALLLYAKPDVNRAVREYVDKVLRPAARRTVNLQIEILEAEGPLAAALAEATGGEVDASLLGRIQEARGAAKVRRVFDGRVLGLSRQQIVLWHGAQVAMVPDADVEVATNSETVDPLVEVEMGGTSLEATSTVGDDGRIRLRLWLDFSELDRETRTVETERAGALQMPARSTATVQADLWTGNDRWAVAGERTTADGKRRFLLVRPSVIGGGR